MVRMKDIAEKAGVSQASVSLALGNHPLSKRLNEKTRAKIIQAAKDLGYRKNAFARAMVTGKNLIIGFGSHNPSLWHHALLLDGIMESVEGYGFVVKTFAFRDTPENITAIVDQVLSYKLAGMICDNPPMDFVERLRREDRSHSVPLVFVNPDPDSALKPNVFSDDVDGCRKVVEHLFSLGHRKMAFIGARQPAAPFQTRLKGIRTACKSLKIQLPKPCLLTFEKSGDFESAERAADAIAGMKSPPTAIFCATDSFAAVVIRRLRRHGFHIPLDFSVVGFSDHPVAELCDPALTTVRQPFRLMGIRAVEALLSQQARLDRRAKRPALELLPVDLVVRESTGPVRR